MQELIIISTKTNCLPDTCHKVVEHLYESFYNPETELMTLESWGWALLITAVLLIFITATITYKKIRETGLLVFFAGCILYAIGYANEGTGKSVLAWLIRSMMSSLEMFLGHSDLIEVHTLYHGKDWYMTLFVLVHFMALFVSVVVVFNVFFKRIFYKIKLFFVSLGWISNATDDLYIFFGLDRNSEILAKDIRDKKRNAYIVFVGLNRQEDNEIEEETSFWKLMGVFTTSNAEVDRIWELGIHSHYAHSKTDFKELADEFIRNKNPHEKLAIISALGLKNLRRLILRCRNVKFFFMSDDHRYNLLSLDVLVTDTYFNIEPQNGHRAIVYCHARRENTNVIREQQYFAYSNIEVHIVDASYLSVLTLRQDPKNLPVEFVKIENGRVTTPFHAMVVGFGETGQEALKYLYEYGTFDGGQSVSQLHCIIVDDKMEAVRASFLSKRPALKVDADGFRPQHIDFWNCSVCNLDFWDRLKGHISDMNYVVIAMGDDELNTSFAMDLYEFAIRYRENQLENFRIYVRVYTSSNETRLSYIEKYLNNSNRWGRVINVFGLSDKIFTYSIVSLHDEEEPIMEKVKMYYDNYRKLSKDEDTWSVRRRKKLKLKKNEAYDSEKVYKDLFFGNKELFRLESQDFANYFHISTKLKLLGIPNDNNITWKDLSLPTQMRILDIYSALMSCIKNEMSNVDGYPEEIWNLIVAVSKTEHYRWNNAHKMMGYEYREENGDDKYKRDVRMTHKCITDWSCLSPGLQSYDAMVVATTLMVRFPEILN